MSSASRGILSTDRYIELLSSFIRQTRPQVRTRVGDSSLQTRRFHDYFVTHLPSSSLHPDSRSATGLAHKFPRKDSKPHTPNAKTTPAAHPSISRDTTVVRIPLKSAKHHYGAAVSRGSRPYNEDSHQAGVIELPAFAKKPPQSITVGKGPREATSADGASGDPQVFYFGVFDGHGGAECSDYLRARLHEYIEKTAADFEIQSSLQQNKKNEKAPGFEGTKQEEEGEEALAKVTTSSAQDVDKEAQAQAEDHTKAEGRSGEGQRKERRMDMPYPGDLPLMQLANQATIHNLEKSLVQQWKELVGGYFRRFKPAYFSLYSGYHAVSEDSLTLKASGEDPSKAAAIEEVITYAFLKADYDFVAAQAAKQDESRDLTMAERPLNDADIWHSPSQVADHIGDRIGGPRRFKGGSTCSVAMVSTPSPTPFWNPSTTSTVLVAHVGDTRILVCSTATGQAIPLTTDHHPSSPIESNRLRRYATAFVTDSFGEERISGLANTRAFGDIASKRIGVSAEPEIKRLELGAAEFSFMVLVSDGVSGTLSDQEIVDIVKEAKTPEEAARDVVNFATEVTREGDNATCLVIRLGGWGRRQEGGHGSLGTKEKREWKREDAANPRGSRM